jgi:putative DNA methylase
VPLNYIREEGKAGRMSAQLMAIAAEGPRQRYYVAPNEEHEKAADLPRPDDVPDAEIPHNPRYLTAPNYGMKTWADLFTNRQLTALTTFSDLIRETRERIMADGAEPGYSSAVTTYLSLSLGRLADYSCTIATWVNAANMEIVGHAFTRQAVPMTWDFAEAAVLAESSGSFSMCYSWAAKVLETAVADEPHPGIAIQGDAKIHSAANGMLVATDPPYYDNVGYADLADFFYVWLRRSLVGIYPELTGTVLTPKADELVADPFRQGNDELAEQFFEHGFNDVFSQICRSTPHKYPITVFYAFKQSESDADGGHASTGWETLLEGMLTAGWAVTATWPVRTERRGRMRDIGSNALASSIVLACRPRSADAGFTDRRGLIGALREEFPDALRKLEQGKIAPVDLRQAAIGPGMAVFSRYARVNEPDGSRMRVRAALSLINQVLDEKLSQLEGDVSAETRWCVEWFKHYHFESGPFGTAETLSRGVDTSVDGLERAGVLKSRAGKVKLLSVEELPEGYNPAIDDRTSEWEICLHLAKRLQDQGADAAARLIAAARNAAAVDLDDVKELAYLLYSIAEKKGWAETALLFNNLGTSWTDLEDASRKMTGPVQTQGQLTMEYGNDDGDE